MTIRLNRHIENLIGPVDFNPCQR